MRYKKCGKRWIVRIDKGEEILGTLKQFCETNAIRLGSVSGIGATDKVIIGLFETGTKTYHTEERIGDHEITSLCGTISRMNREVYLHIHITVSDAHYQTYGGHLSSAIVSGTCEIIIDEIDGEVERERNEEVGLNIYKL